MSKHSLKAKLAGRQLSPVKAPFLRANLNERRGSRNSALPAINVEAAGHSAYPA
jgi:hypothetical protein